MIALVVLLAVALVAVIGVAAQRASVLGQTRVQVTELETRVAGLEADLAAANTRADIAEGKAIKAAGDTAAAKKDASAAAATAKAEAKRANTAETHAAAAAARADDTEAALARWPADGVWTLEERRIGRLWRERVSVTLDGTSPVSTAPDRALAATEVFAEASREDAGVVVDIDWHVDPVPTGSEAVLLVRIAEELIATAWYSDGGTLAVTSDADHVVLRLTTEPVVPLADDLAAAIESCGAAISAGDDGAIVVRLPRG